MPRLDFDVIKREFQIVDIAPSLGVELKRYGREYRCKSIFEPGNNKTCTTVYPDTNTFYDWKTKQKGSVLDFVAQVKYESTEIDYIFEAARYLAGDKFDSGYWEEWKSRAKDHEAQMKKFESDIDAWHEALLSQDNETAIKAREYLHSRNISDETIDRFKIGLHDRKIEHEGKWYTEPRIVFPFFGKDNKPYYYSDRECDFLPQEQHGPKYMKCKTTQYTRNIPMGLNTLPVHEKDFDCLVIGEGILDCLSAVQQGFSCLFSGGLDFGENEKKVINDYCMKTKKIILAYDSDEAGQNTDFEFGMKLLKAGIFNFSVVTSYGAGLKDLSDFHAAGGQFSKLFESVNIQSGLIFLAKRLSGGVHYNALSTNEKSELTKAVKDFMKAIKDSISEDELKQIRKVIREYYPSGMLEAAENVSNKEILFERRDAFLADYPHLFFTGDIQHGSYYDYNSNFGYWELISDAILQARIFERFVRMELPKNVRDIADLVRLSRTRDYAPKFNQKPLFNFKNGTLELDTGIFREHNPEDYQTYTVGYDYDKNADCPKFKKFLDEITAGEQSRINFLLDMAAYVLVPDCRYEKMFFLLGNGNNGKSTLLEIISALYENSNESDKSQTVTTVPLSDLDKPTERVLLMNSMFNLVFDSKSNLTGIESYLKSIISGEKISGNFKFKDGFTFRPRTKLICNCNEMPKFRDKSGGMKRRVMFCYFPVDFTGRENETLDTEIISEELPGIFNLVYKTYQELLERRKIRTSCDQEASLQEFTELANPVLAFWESKKEEYTEAHEMPKSQVFDDWCDWCKRNNVHASRENVFHKDLLNIVKVETFRKRVTGEDKQTYWVRFPMIKPESEAPEVMTEQPEQPIEMVQGLAIEQKPELSPELQAAIDACNERYKGHQMVTENVINFVGQDLLSLSMTQEYLYSHLTENEAVALDCILQYLNRHTEAEKAQRVWVEHFNNRPKA